MFYNRVGRKSSARDPIEHLAHDCSFLRYQFNKASRAGSAIDRRITIPVRSKRAEVFFPDFDLVTAPAPCPIRDQLTFELGEASEDVHHEVVRWAVFRRKLAKN